MLDGNSALSPSQLANAGGNDPSSPSSTQTSLSDIANGFFSSIAQSAAQGVGNIISNKTRAQTTAPVPDIAAAAAKPQVSTFLSGSVGGVSTPILLLGAAALLFLIVKR